MGRERKGRETIRLDTRDTRDRYIQRKIRTKREMQRHTQIQREAQLGVVMRLVGLPCSLLPSAVLVVV